MFDLLFPHANLVRLAACLKRKALIPSDVRQLETALVHERATFPDDLLFSIMKNADKAFERTQDAALTAAILHISRNALWEIQTRNRSS